MSNDDKFEDARTRYYLLGAPKVPTEEEKVIPRLNKAITKAELLDKWIRANENKTATNVTLNRQFALQAVECAKERWIAQAVAQEQLNKQRGSGKLQIKRKRRSRRTARKRRSRRTARKRRSI